MTKTPHNLEERINAARAKYEDTVDVEKKQDDLNTRRGLRAGMDFISAFLVSGFLGYWLDRWLETQPLFIVIMIVLGFAAGLLNIHRRETGQDLKVGFRDDTDTTRK